DHDLDQGACKVPTGHCTRPSGPALCWPQRRHRAARRTDPLGLETARRRTMFPDLLMVATRTDADFGALAVATALAERTSAHLAVLVAVETALPMVTEWGGF